MHCNKYEVVHQRVSACSFVCVCVSMCIRVRFCVYHHERLEPKCTPGILLSIDLEWRFARFSFSRSTQGFGPQAIQKILQTLHSKTPSKSYRGFDGFQRYMIDSRRLFWVQKHLCCFHVNKICGISSGDLFLFMLISQRYLEIRKCLSLRSRLSIPVIACVSWWQLGSEAISRWNWTDWPLIGSFEVSG